MFQGNKLLSNALSRDTIRAEASGDINVELNPQDLSADEQYTVKMFCWDNKLNPLDKPLITTI